MNRIFIGKYNGTFAFRVSKPGRAVESTNNEDFLLNESTYNAAPILVGTVSSLPFWYRIGEGWTNYYIDDNGNIVYDGDYYYDNAYRLVIPHYLGYTPIFLTSMAVDGDVYIDNTNLYITGTDRKYNDSSTPPLNLQYPISYYIFSVNI
jgi:hypothetical protein